MSIVFSDWDGTITLQDSNDYLTENLGFGVKKRLEINDDILYGKKSFKDGFQEMLDSIDTPFPECIDILLANIQLDTGFRQFYEWCTEKGITVVVVSSGMTPIIHALLTKLVGAHAAANIEIISNDVKIDEKTGKWDIVYRHPETSFGHDKSISIKSWLKDHKIDTANTNLYYCGDGVSDLLAAKETDLLFAKHGKDLIKYCISEKIPYTEFRSFDDILRKIKQIEAGESIQAFLTNESKE